LDLDHLAVDLRPRSAWEAVDLGFRLARRHYLRLLAVSFLVTAPIVALAQALFWSSPTLALLLPWWLKPIWERAPLHVLSRALFGDVPGTRDTLRALRRAAFRDALTWLTVRRLSPTRSLDMPVTLLEGLTGTERTQRLAVLRRGPFASAGVWLTVVCAHVELALPLAALALVELLVPDTFEWSVFAWVFGGGADAGLDALVTGLLGHAAALAVAPFYVGAGFSLYVHRRARLEGWDLEIAFRRLTARVRGAGVRAAAVALAVLAAGGAAALPAAADDGPAPGAAPTTREEIEQARAEIRSVLDGDAFHATETFRIPRFIDECRLEPSAEEPPPELPAWLVRLIEWIAVSAEVLLAAALLGLVGWLAWRASRVPVPRAAPDARRARARPRRVLGLDVTPGSLPDDVPDAVLRAWRAGRVRDAMALLYRATLVRLVDAHGVELDESHTEAECLAAARIRLDAMRAALFAELTRGWLVVAYAHRRLPDERIEALCARWREAFGPPTDREVADG